MKPRFLALTSLGLNKCSDCKHMKKQLFQCPECGLHYDNKQIAKQCEVFCKDYKGCSLEITQHSIEAQKARASNKLPGSV